MARRDVDIAPPPAVMRPTTRVGGRRVTSRAGECREEYILVQAADANCHGLQGCLFCCSSKGIPFVCSCRKRALLEEATMGGPNKTEPRVASILLGWTICCTGSRKRWALEAVRL